MAYVKRAVAASAITLLAWTGIFWTGLASGQGAPAPAPAPAPTTPAATTTATATATADTAPVTNPDLGDPGAFVIDQVSGFRGRVGGGVSYYGPLGVAFNTFGAPSAPQFSCSGTPSVCSNTQTETTVKSWSIWLAPSIDYFLAKNLSVGGLFSIDTTFGSSESKTTTQTGGATGVTTKTQSTQGDLPSVTSFTLMPRIGYFLRVNDRLSFWPRVGVGYFSGTSVTVTPKTEFAGTSGERLYTETQSVNVKSLLFQFDVGIIYQITDNVFFRAAPALTFSSNGSGAVTYKTNATSTGGGTVPPDSSGSGSAFQFELTSGFGANFSL